MMKELTEEQSNALLFDLGEYARSIAPAWAIVRPVRSFDDSLRIDTKHGGWGESGFSLRFKPSEGAAINGPATERSPSSAMLVAEIMHQLAVLGAAIESQWKQVVKAAANA